MGEFNITFELLKISDLPLILKWFNTPHVVNFFSLRDNWTFEETRNKLLPYINQEKPVKCYLIKYNNTSIGMVQSYPIKNYPWPLQDFSDDVILHGAGMDLFIGELDYIGKGIGRSVIKKFVDDVLWKDFNYCVVDPDVKNAVMIHCCEKIGFKEHKIIQTEDTLKRPVELRLMIMKK